MYLLKTDELVQISVQSKNDEQVLINNIVERFKKDGYMASNFKILNSNPNNNELFAEIKIVDNMKHVKMTLNNYKTYTINDIFNATYTLNEFSFTTEPNSDYTKTFTFMISNSEIGEQLQLGFSHNAKLEVEDNVFKTVIHPTSATFKELNSTNLISTDATIGNVKYPNTSSTQYKIMRLNNNNELEWVDNKDIIVNSGLNITVIPAEGLDNEFYYQTNLNSTLTNLTKITTNQAKIGNVEYPSSSSTQNKIMKLNNANTLEWADDNDTITEVVSGSNITVTEPSAHRYQVDLKPVLNNLTKITSTDATIGNVKYPNTSSTQNKIMQLNNNNELVWAYPTDLIHGTPTQIIATPIGNGEIGLNFPSNMSVPADLTVHNDGQFEAGNVKYPIGSTSKVLDQVLKLTDYNNGKYIATWNDDKDTITTLTQGNNIHITEPIQHNYVVSLSDNVIIDGNLKVNDVVLPGPLSAKEVGKTIKITGNIAGTYSTDWIYPINAIYGTTNEITANTTDDTTTLSLPTNIIKSQGSIKYISKNVAGNDNTYMKLDTTGTTSKIRLTTIDELQYTTMTPTDFMAINASSSTYSEIKPQYISTTDGTNKLSLYAQGLLSVNNSFGNNGDVLMSQGGILPVKWTTLTETYSTTIQMQTGGTVNAWLANLYLTRTNNVVLGRISLNGGTLINYTSATTTGIIGKATIATNLLPTVNQYVGKCDICYFSTSSTSTLAAFGTMSMYVLNSSGQLQITLRTDPIGTGTTNPSFGVSATGVYPYFAPGYGWNSAIDINPNAGINFHYFSS